MIHIFVCRMSVCAGVQACARCVFVYVHAPVVVQLGSFNIKSLYQYNNVSLSLCSY